MPEVVWNSRGAEKVFADNEKVLKSVRNTGDAYKDTARDAQDMGRIVARITKDNETAHERLARQLVNAGHAREQGKISAQQLAREEARVTVEFLRQTDGVNKLTSAQLHHIDIKRRYQQQIQHEIQMLPQLQSETQKLMGHYTTGGVELKKFGEARHDAMGENAVGEAIAFGAEVLGVTELLTRMGEAAREAAEDGRKAIQAAREGGSLAVESGGDPKKLAGLRSEAKKTFSEGGFDKLGEAYKLQGALASGGLQDERGFFSKLQEVEDATAAADEVGKVRKTFGKRSGSASQILSMGGQVARDLPGASRGAVLDAVGKSGIAANRLGIGPDEIYAAVDALGGETGDVGDAGSRVQIALKKFADLGYKGSLGDILNKVGGRNLSERGYAKKFGKAGESISALVKSRGTFDTDLAGIRTARDRDVVSQEVASQMALPETVYGRYGRSVKAQGELANEERGLQNHALEATFEGMKAMQRRNLPSVIAEPLIGLEDVGNMALPAAAKQAIYGPTAKYQSQPGGPQSMDELAKAMERNTAETKKQNEILQRDQQQPPKASAGPRE